MNRDDKFQIEPPEFVPRDGFDVPGGCGCGAGRRINIAPPVRQPATGFGGASVEALVSAASNDLAFDVTAPAQGPVAKIDTMLAAGLSGLPMATTKALSTRKSELRQLPNAVVPSSSVSTLDVPGEFDVGMVLLPAARTTKRKGTTSLPLKPKR